MPKIIRALLISAAATGVAAIVLKTLRPEAAKPPATRQGAGPYIDADHLSDEQRDLLMQEMAAGM